MDVEDRHCMGNIPDAALVEEKTAGQHEVVMGLEGLQTYLHEELGRMMVIPRTKRQLRSKVIALRILQDDMLENEEEHILPVMRQCLSAAQQYALMWHLLIDDEAEDALAILDWVRQASTASEQQFLDTLQDVLVGLMR
ncbi:MAG: hypothetical protein FJZ47_17090 [Candidatus Tectomicrobia bacterium]|uniref:Uncharacterized protein n=1 Tax=Tectimicrobiota bacterium TaxID=2528274 RepID=A0A937W247_UNCTE|nr:hypothetical protein [Candidatus Tectomicrobia bacterium]